jgi:hypothetical protein
MTIRIKSKDDVIRLILERTGAMPRLSRAYDNGGVEFLGGFIVVDKDRPGWIVKFKNALIGLVAHGFNVYVVQLHEVRWSLYNGDSSHNGLYQGDHPETYKLLKQAEAVWPVNRATKTL